MHFDPDPCLSPLQNTQVEGEPEALCAESGVTCYRFYGPLHRGDNDPGGTIRVIH